MSYGTGWLCVVEGTNLDDEVPRLKIGKSAVTLIQDDIPRLREILKKTDDGEPTGPAFLYVGALENLDDARWETATRELFGNRRD